MGVLGVKARIGEGGGAMNPLPLWIAGDGGGAAKTCDCMMLFKYGDAGTLKLPCATFGVLGGAAPKPNIGEGGGSIRVDCAPKTGETFADFL